MSKEIILLGTGKLGTHLAKAIHNQGYNLSWIYNRTIGSAKELAKDVGAQVTDNLAELPRIEGLYLFTVSDAAISCVASELSTHLGPDIQVAHTSGGTPSTIFQGIFKDYGVFYPLQSFSKEVEPNFKTIPFCISASSEVLERNLMSLAKKLSDNVFQLSDEQRAQVHLAGVFANNFVNVLFGVAFELLEKADIPKDILWPIIQMTIQKIENQDPADVQTGPALREDQTTMDRHLNSLKGNPDLTVIYQTLSDLIIKRKKK